MAEAQEKELIAANFRKQCAAIVGGTFMGGAAMFLALKFHNGSLSNRSSSFLWSRGNEVSQSTLLRESEERILSMVRQEVQSSISTAESRLGTRLHGQEVALVESLRNHCIDLHTRFEAVSATRDELSTVARKLEDLRSVFFASPKRRGSLGEKQLEWLVRDVLHPGSYAFQVTLSNGRRPDCLLTLPPPIGNVAIDSKFPLDAFWDIAGSPPPPINNDSKIAVNGSGSGDNQILNPDGNAESARIAAARTRLSDNLKKQIRDIATKYIIPGETADCAMLFVPSEALFAEIVEHHPNAVAEAHKHRVWITSPTTLMAVLTTMQGAVQGVVISERAHAVVEEVGALVADVGRLVDRAAKVEKNVENARENLRLMRVSIDKVQRRKSKLDTLSEELEDHQEEDEKEHDQQDGTVLSSLSDKISNDSVDAGKQASAVEPVANRVKGVVEPLTKKKDKTSTEWVNENRSTVIAARSQ